MDWSASMIPALWFTSPIWLLPMLPDPWMVLLTLVSTSAATPPSIMLLALFESVTMPPPVSETAELPITKRVLLPTELMVMPPEPVWFELVMVVPSMVSAVLLKKFRMLALPIVRLPPMVSLTLSVTNPPELVMTALLLIPGIVPRDQVVAFQLPVAPFQLSSVMIRGRAKGWNPKACTTRLFPEIIRRMAFCPRSLTGCLAARSSGACAKRPARPVQAIRQANKSPHTHEIPLLSRRFMVTVAFLLRMGRRKESGGTLTLPNCIFLQGVELYPAGLVYTPLHKLNAIFQVWKSDEVLTVRGHFVPVPIGSRVFLIQRSNLFSRCLAGSTRAECLNSRQYSAFSTHTPAPNPCASAGAVQMGKIPACSRAFFGPSRALADWHACSRPSPLAFFGGSLP